MITFDDLWNKGLPPGLLGMKECARLAWNEAINASASVVERRGAEIGGAIQPDKTAKEIRALSSNKDSHDSR
jgi:hypothetical protein